jgi:hypothetical protein
VGQHGEMGVPRWAGRPVGLPSELVWPSRLDPTGRRGPTRGQARGPAWRRIAYGLYVPAATAPGLEQRIVEAAARLPAYGGVTGWAGLRWTGGVWFGGLDGLGQTQRPVVLATASRSIRPGPGLAVSQERLDPTELTGHLGLAVTTPVHSLFFEMRHARGHAEAVAVADMAAYSDLVSRREAVAYAAARPGWTGIGRMREALVDMDENAWSPTEVAMRQVWCRDAGLPRPACNHPVFDLAGGLLGTPDLLDPVAGVVGEYDGALHLEGAQRARDVRREGVFRAAGLEYVTMLAADLAEPAGFVTRLRQAYARASRTPATDRAWTAQLPAWWIPTFTVEQRRGLDDDQRARLLRLRLRAG